LKEPGDGNVKLKLPPGGMFGEPHTLIVDVLVWESISLFTHVTVAPTDTVPGFGTYAVVVNPVAPRGMEIVNGAGVPTGTGRGVGVGTTGVVDGLLLPQPAARTAKAARATATDTKRIGTLSPARREAADTLMPAAILTAKTVASRPTP
jgi:hypothetical protein